MVLSTPDVNEVLDISTFKVQRSLCCVATLTETNYNVKYTFEFKIGCCVHSLLKNSKNEGFYLALNSPPGSHEQINP
jgi:hypothetical protein